jgi:peptidoglycan/LPS O-acetylase OafA/YrhL
VKHLPQLDGLRALALLMVFAHHAWAIHFLWSGVDLFFILSGYLITGILLRDSERMRFGPLLKHFFLRRAQRILPAYVACLGLIASFSHVHWTALWPFYAFFLQNVPVAFHLLDSMALVPLWSLAVEQHFYLVWPLVVFFVPRRFLAPSMIGVLLLVPVLRWICTPHFAYPEAIYALTPFRIDTIAAGALAAIWLPRVRPAVATRWAQASLVLAVVLLFGLHNQPWFSRAANSRGFNCFGYSINILLLGGLFVWAVLAEGGWMYQILSWRPLRELGRISYSFYLLHVLVLSETTRHIVAWYTPLLAFVMTGVLATLSWRLVEAPILRLPLAKSHHGRASTV